MPVIALADEHRAPPTEHHRPTGVGWSWAVWGHRRHYLTGDGRTLCGRRWDGGFACAAASILGDDRCLTCERLLAKRQEDRSQ